MNENNDKLCRYINDFASHVEKYAPLPEDKLLMASAMLTVVKAIYLENSITPEIADKVFERQIEDVFQVNLIKPTYH